ncbi:MAG TPA: sulfotransferase [Pirellulales bacterium]|nr:sulfotransferase [Pirellulales bacterium]
MGARSPSDDSPFDVPSWLHWLGGLVDRHPNFCIRLARLESSSLAKALRQVPVTMPIYVCGLARSGTTLLHEVVASHPSVATQQMKDYPMVFTPYWWRRATAKRRLQPPRERAHRDGVMVTTESPDALEEMLWMAFFCRCHDPSVSNVLGGEERHPAFEPFYRDHIRKLLLAEQATRYAAKANYHVARLAYIVRLFPDARFLIAVRSPRRHIGSLARQHEWFCQGHRRSPRALAFMQRSGHFEFGLDRRPMQLGDASRTAQIIDDWAAGREVRGWARYWDMVYSHLGRLLDSDAQVRAASLIVRYEALCESPAETLRAVLGHCSLPDCEAIVERFAAAIRDPAYYTSRFSPDDEKIIDEATADTARWWGYE